MRTKSMGASSEVQPHPPAAVEALNDDADRQAAREEAPVAGGEDAVAGLHRIDPAQIVELGRAAAVAGEDGAGVGAVVHHRRAAGDVGQQKDAADAVRDADDPADQAPLAHHRIADRDAGLDCRRRPGGCWRTDRGCRRSPGRATIGIGGSVFRPSRAR